MPSWISYLKLFGKNLRNLKLFFLVVTSTFIPNKYTGLALAAAPTPYIVVLDPGHGGADKGASIKDNYEKDLALGIAIRIGRVLNDPKYWSPLGRRIKVVFTRTKDYDVSLETRSRIAHENKADLFVSIHLNSEPTGTVSGIESYFLNNTDDTSNAKLAEIENKNSRKYASVKPEALVLRSIAADAVVESSHEAAELIHNSILQYLEKQGSPVHNRGVKQALLYVLLDAQTPAVLLEPGFLSHKRDLSFLSQGENRQKLAEGIARGILRYLALR